MTPHIGDQNVERLLTAAYQPETPDPAFVARIEARLCAAAQELAAARSDQGTAPEDLRLRAVRRRLGWAMGVAAAVAVVALALHAGGRRVPQSTGSAEAVGKRGSMDQVEFGSPVSYRGMTARARPAAPAVKPLAVGEVLTTQVGQRRRVTLADGSVVYLNQNTSVTQVAPRHLELSRGEIYLEVAPREAGSVGATFLVKTPTREVAALGTRFAVDVNRDGTGVVVTQGTVKVSGLEAVLRAGQQVAPGALRIAPAQRASYVLDWTRELMAAAESPLVPGSKHAGGALVAVDPQGQEVALTLRKYHLDIHIEDGFARTTIDQTYFNHEYGRLEGTFYFPLPADAALSRLAMYVEENGVCRLMEGGMAERDHARNVFETIRYTQRDPALLEWVDGSTFKMRVFPLEGRKEKRLLLSYTQKLPTLYGKTTYRFPTGHSLHHDLSFRARVKHGAALTWDSATPLQASREGDDLILTANKAALDRDFVLSLSASAQAEGVARFSSFTHEDAQYLMLRYRPRLASPPQRQRRDWVFLFESSANRDPLLARVQIDVIRTLLLNADHDDTFALLTAGTRVHGLAEKRQPVTPENIQAAVEFLEGTHLIGALDLEQALRAAAPFLKSATNPHLIHVGAGFAAIGERNPDVLVKRIPDGTRYVGVGIGKRWSRAFMKMAADRTGGAFTQINPDEPIAWRAFDLLATLNAPRLMDVRVVDGNENITFLTDTSTAAQGEEICAIARLERRAGGVNPLIPRSVKLSGKVDGKPFLRELAVKNVAPNAGYLPRQWAKLEIDRLLADGAEKNRQRIVELSKAMYVMSPYTSLLVLETDADYARFKVDRGRKDHWAMYACPQRIPIVYEALPSAHGLSNQQGFVAPSLRPNFMPQAVNRPFITTTKPTQGPLIIGGAGFPRADQPVGIMDGDKSKPPTSLPPPPGWGSGQGGGQLVETDIDPPAIDMPGGVAGLRGVPLPGSFYGRSGATKQKALTTGGGTTESEAAFARGLKWIVAQQCPDGHWALDGAFQNPGDHNDIAGTAFGLLPLVGAGYTHKAARNSKINPFEKPIEKGLAFLMRMQEKRTGNFGGSMYGHALATMAICETYGLSRDERLRLPAQKAVNFLVMSQHFAGGWPSKPHQASELSVTGWVVLALKSAELADLDVPEMTWRKAIYFLDSVNDPRSEGYGSMSPKMTPAMTAVGLLCRQYLENWGPNSLRLQKGIENLKRIPPSSSLRNMSYYYYATQVIHHLGGESWAKWNEAMRPKLISDQDLAPGPLLGSWSPAGDEHAAEGGRLMHTSLILLTLEVYYRYLPLYRGQSESDRLQALAQTILKDENIPQSAPLWRLAAERAGKRATLAYVAARLDNALDQEYRNLPQVVNLQAVRENYGCLLGLYRQLAFAAGAMENDARANLLARVIRAADRWRSLDSDCTAACHTAAKILQILGAQDLAWDYLTTPIGMKPNEAAPWLHLAQTLHDDGESDLADRAYALAFAAEATNAQILWDRAQNLQQAGRFDQAFALYRQIADGTWQPRFQGLVQQARGMLHR